MTRWYPLAPCDESYFAGAPHVYRFVQELAVPPERVWESLTSPHSVADWSPLLKSIEWTSDLGRGATRTVVLPLSALTLHEYFFRWEEGSRFSFYGVQANRPLLGRIAEDYLVEESGSGTRFTWTFALEGTARTKLLVKALSPVNRLNFRQMAHGAKGYFARVE
ncbi:MAG: hypothetical protein QOJ37_672 [Pseudonocardiales bacterium]|nr:hypothetical protein [Pseudonocardiales bacterium]